MKWPIQIVFPRVFGWDGLAFADRLKLLALIFQAGAGVAMTGMSAYALYHLARSRAVWPLFYMGFGALALIGIIVTGFGALLYKRTVEFNAFGASFKAQDQEGAAQLAQQVKEISNVQRADQQGVRSNDAAPVSGDPAPVADQGGGNQGAPPAA